MAEAPAKRQTAGGAPDLAGSTVSEEPALALWRFALRHGALLLNAGSVLLIAAIFAAHLWASLTHAHVNNFSNPEEWAYTNVTSGNYLRFGFVSTLLLQDVSSSPDPEDHPYIYNHMPAGPDAATALVRKAVDNDFRLMRILFALLALPGIWYLVRFTELLLAPLGRLPAALVVFVTGPVFFVNQMEAQINSIYLLLAFAPLVWGLRYATAPSLARLVAICAALFFLSIYVQYVLVSAVVFAWVYLYLLRVAPLPGRLLVCAIGSVAAGVLAHLLQNLAWLGPETFARELLYTLGNRAFGTPSQEELAQFYESIHVVNHGSHALQADALLHNLRANLLFDFWVLALVLVALVLLWKLLRRPISGASADPAERESSESLWLVFKLFLWADATVVSVILLFPAFSQGVNLASYGMDQLFFAIPTAAAIAAAWRASSAGWRQLPRSLRMARLRVARLGAAGLLGVGAFVAAPEWLWNRLRPDVQESLAVALTVGLVVLPFFVLLARVPALAGVRARLSTGLQGVFTALAARRERSLGERAHVVSAIALRFCTVLSIAAVLFAAIREYREVWRDATGPSEFAGIDELARFGPELFMTNINVPVVGFFTGGAGYGVCGLESVDERGALDVTSCRISYMRRKEYWQQQTPRFFFYFKEVRMFPGFAPCRPSRRSKSHLRSEPDCVEQLGDRLAAAFPIVTSNELFEVYDLHAPRRRVTP